MYTLPLVWIGGPVVDPIGEKDMVRGLYPSKGDSSSRWGRLTISKAGIFGRAYIRTFYMVNRAASSTLWPFCSSGQILKDDQYALRLIAHRIPGKLSRVHRRKVLTWCACGGDRWTSWLRAVLFQNPGRPQPGSVENNSSCFSLAYLVHFSRSVIKLSFVFAA